MCCPVRLRRAVAPDGCPCHAPGARVRRITGAARARQPVASLFPSSGMMGRHHDTLFRYARQGAILPHNHRPPAVAANAWPCGTLACRPPPSLAFRLNQDIFRIPLRLAMCFARLGDFLRLHPMTSTALRQFQARLISADPDAFVAATRIQPAGFHQILASQTRDGQDLWHAHLFLLRPLVRLSLAALWIGSGLAGLFGHSALPPGISERLFSYDWGWGTAVLACGVDLLVGTGLLFGWSFRLLFSLQLGLVTFYTVGLGTAFHLYLTHLSGNTVAIAYAVRTTVWADWCFIAPSALLQPISGWFLVSWTGAVITLKAG